MDEVPATSLAVRRATEADAGRLAEIHRASAVAAYAGIFPPDAPPPTVEALTADWGALVVDAKAWVILAEAAAGGPIGVAALTVDRGAPAGILLKRLYVDPAHQGRGAGALLHDQVVAEATRRGHRAINLWVLEANDRARRMYERWGWQLVPGPTVANDPPSIVDVLYRRDLAGRRSPTP